MTDSLTLQLPTAADTHQLGEALAGLLRAGDLIVLTGPLGAGKTVFAQGLGAGLSVPAAITSPTFVIARVHQGGRLPLVHVDAYRLGSLAEVDDLDLDVTVDLAVTVVEWGAGRAEQLADSWLTIDLQRAEDEQRVAQLAAHGGDWAGRLQQLLSDGAD